MITLYEPLEKTVDVLCIAATICYVLRGLFNLREFLDCIP